MCQLPAGRWTTAPTLVEMPEGARLLAASVEGLVVGLDEKFQVLWQHRLAGETDWGRATPGQLQTASGLAFVFGDGAGTLTCLSPNGKTIWTNALGAGPIKAPPQRYLPGDAGERLLVAAGKTLFCLDSAGQVRWRRDLPTDIQTKPAAFGLPGVDIVLCGTASGSLFCLSSKGDILWECPLGDPFSGSLVLLQRSQSDPLILCPGLWGNLHAVDVQGHPVWSQLFRTKTRARPLVLNPFGNGRQQIYLPTFHQHVYVFDENGNLYDDLHLSGILPSALTPIVDPATRHPDLLVTSTTLLGYRLRPGPPKSPYGKTGEATQVALEPPAADDAPEIASLKVRNPHGALINVKLTLTDTNGWTRILSSLSARSAFEIPLPALVRAGKWSLHATAHDTAGQLLDEKSWNLPSTVRREPDLVPAPDLYAWPTEPYGAFEERRLTPPAQAHAGPQKRTVMVENLYQDEADQGAFIIVSTFDDTVRARVTLTNVTNQAGVPFGGQVVLARGGRHRLGQWRAGS